MRAARTDEEHQATTVVTTTRGPLLDVDAVAEALGVTPRHIRRLVAERRIPFFKVGKFVRFDPGALDLWLDQRQVDVQGSPSSGRRSQPVA
jgi:excisionase family DNA binding protein